MESVRSERRWVALTLAVLFLMAVSRSLPAPAGIDEGPAIRGSTSEILAAAGGRRPPALKECALAIGLFVGGIAGMGVNPMIGAACISWGFHVALVTCI